MISPSALRIGQKVNINGVEWTVDHLTPTYAGLVRIGPFNSITANYSELNPCDIVPTEEDKATEELLDLCKKVGSVYREACLNGNGKEGWGGMMLHLVNKIESLHNSNKGGDIAGL